jgi:hypothetical protein
MVLIAKPMATVAEEDNSRIIVCEGLEVINHIMCCGSVEDEQIYTVTWGCHGVTVLSI